MADTSDDWTAKGGTLPRTMPGRVDVYRVLKTSNGLERAVCGFAVTQGSKISITLWQPPLLLEIEGDENPEGPPPESRP